MITRRSSQGFFRFRRTAKDLSQILLVCIQTQQHCPSQYRNFIRPHRVQGPFGLEFQDQNSQLLSTIQGFERLFRKDRTDLDDPSNTPHLHFSLISESLPNLSMRYRPQDALSSPLLRRSHRQKKKTTTISIAATCRQPMTSDFGHNLVRTIVCYFRNMTSMT